MTATNGNYFRNNQGQALQKNTHSMYIKAVCVTVEMKQGEEK